jgi:predicted helicase
MSLQYVQDYLAELARLRRVSGSGRETIVREAFKDLLKRYARQKELVFVAEYPLVTNRKKNIFVDGALVYSLRVPLGYYEAKDENDKLDDEIDKKFRAGYPQDNIIFEDTREAVLIQNKEIVMRCPIEDAPKLTELLGLFFAYERPEIADFRKAVQQFALDLPAITSALNDLIEQAGNENPDYQQAEIKFLQHAKDTINPTVTLTDVREMLMQHILTEEIFAHVFNDADFHRENNVARELYALERTFFKDALKRETLKSLDPYYTAIKANAAQISTHSEKQKFLKVIYENFYKVYNPKAADRLGVVYTPNEIVKFMIDGADWLCRKHFGKALIDEGVEILDPATGTGTFVCELLEQFSGSPHKLDRKYREEIHANEVAILPYYVANLNIEATFYALSKQYAAYPNLCFVDTLDNVAGLGKFSGYQGDMFGAVSEENVSRIKRQNERKISIIIGNPPYNANQQNENDNNKNRTYPRIDERIKATYIKSSTAQKTKAYDMYTRFFRWASDRIKDEGIVAFVTNSSFIDARTMDGFRKRMASEFNEIWIINLKGNARTSGERRRQEGGNIFDDQIRVGIAIYFCIRSPKAKGFRLFYESVRDYARCEEKRAFLTKPLSERRFEELQPDAKANWIGQTTNDFESLIPVATKETKAAKVPGQERAIFGLYSNGIVSARDEWTTDFSVSNLMSKINDFCSIYENCRNEWNKSEYKNLKNKKLLQVAIRNFVDRKIKWTEELEKYVINDIPVKFDKLKIRIGSDRPFVLMPTYFDKIITHRIYQNDKIFPITKNLSNICIGFSGLSSSKPFSSLSVISVPSFDLLEKTQFLPLYRYTPSGERIDNITDWALGQFQTAYADPSLRGTRKDGGDGSIITKQDIFHYVYGLLHDPVYRDKYALNLKREFPRLPYYPDFWQWAAWGQALMGLHAGFETVEPWPLTRTDDVDERAKAAGLAPKPKLKSDPEKGNIVLDSETQLSDIPPQVWQYRLGNRSALDWILDQYKEKTPKDPTIREKFNTYRFADYKEKVIDLLARVTRVSVETVAITDAMTAFKR